MKILYVFLLGSIFSLPCAVRAQSPNSIDSLQNAMHRIVRAHTNSVQPFAVMQDETGDVLVSVYSGDSAEVANFITSQKTILPGIMLVRKHFGILVHQQHLFDGVTFADEWEMIPGLYSLWMRVPKPVSTTPVQQQPPTKKL